MKLPQYEQKMLRFFELAFQQTQVTSADFADQAYPKQIGVNAYTIPQLTQNAQESFARTMIQLLAQDAPLTAGMTTQQIMMTTAMKELYAFLDAWEVDDNGNVTDHFRQAYAGKTITVEASNGPIPIAQSVDPASPNFMHWYDPDVATADSQTPGCQDDPIAYPVSAATLHYLLYGSLDNRKGSSGTPCGVFAGSAAAPQLQASDFSDWTMVTIRSPNAGESVTQFWDLPALRTASELVLQIPRVGFFSTPAFFANWQTNTSNQARVTAHQALIVATGSSVDGTDLTTPPGLPGLDATHSNEVACFGCHKVLDPTRSIFSATYSWNYHSQLDPTWTAQPGVFAFRGVIQPVHSMMDFGAALANHPLFASGWVQKLCYYVNSAPCAPSDLQELAGAFQSTGYSWNALVKALVTSPVTTNAMETATSATNGEVIAVARRDHLCASLDARLGLLGCVRPPGNERQGEGADDPRDRLRPAVGRLRTRRAGPDSADAADALLPRRDREHLRGHRGAGDRRLGGRAAGPQAMEQRPAGCGHRRLREPGDGSHLVGPEIGRRYDAAPIAFCDGHEAERRQRHRGAAVHVHRRLLGAVGRLDRNVTRKG